jgi:hypothetical protein
MAYETQHHNFLGNQASVTRDGSWPDSGCSTKVNVTMPLGVQAGQNLPAGHPVAFLNQHLSDPLAVVEGEFDLTQIDVAIKQQPVRVGFWLLPIPHQSEANREYRQNDESRDQVTPLAGPASPSGRRRRSGRNRVGRRCQLDGRVVRDLVCAAHSLLVHGQRFDFYGPGKCGTLSNDTRDEARRCPCSPR